MVRQVTKLKILTLKIVNQQMWSTNRLMDWRMDQKVAFSFVCPLLKVEKVHVVSSQNDSFFHVSSIT